MDAIYEEYTNNSHSSGDTFTSQMHYIIESLTLEEHQWMYSLLIQNYFQQLKN